ncbi:hypothetical protein ACFQX7_37635 [Luedemannella flava]
MTAPTITVGGPSGAVTGAVINRGPSVATDVGVTYRVPTGLVFQNASIAGGSCGYAAPTVVCALSSLAVDASAAVAVYVSAPPGATTGVRSGGFGDVTAREVNPVGGNLLLTEFTPDWVGNDDTAAVSAVWPPSDPYTAGQPPCLDFTNAYGQPSACADRTATTQVVSSVPDVACVGSATVQVSGRGP